MLSLQVSSRIGPTFAALNGCRVAVVLDIPGRDSVVLRGTSRTEHRAEKLLLRIRVEGDEPGQPEIVIEDDRDGLEFQRDERFGCDWVVVMQARAS